MIEFTCLQDLDGKILNGESIFENERIKDRELGMAGRTCIQMAILINQLCTVIRMERVPDQIKMLSSKVGTNLLKISVVPILIKMDHSDNDSVSGEAMNGLSQISRSKDCRDIMRQLPNKDGLKLVAEQGRRFWMILTKPDKNP